MRAQTRAMSFAESMVNVAIGFGIATVANYLVMPLFGFKTSIGTAAGIGLVMTGISIVRSFFLRRVFEALHIHQGGRTMSLSFAILRAVNVARCERWHPGGIRAWSLSDWITATTGELGEAANVVKKLNRVRDGLVGNDKDQASLQSQLADEIADTAIYLDLLATAAGVDLGAAIAAKFNRTSEKNGFPERLPT